MFTPVVTLGPALRDFVDEMLSGSRTNYMHLREGDLLPAMLAEHFTEQQNSDGSAWEPLAPLTQMLRYAGSPDRALVESGDLLDSLIAEVMSDGAVAGSTLFYAGMQQEGFHAPGGRIPLSGTKQEFLEGEATRYPESPHQPRPDAPGHLKIRATETPAREFAYISDEQAGRLIDEAWEVLFA